MRELWLKRTDVNHAYVASRRSGRLERVTPVMTVPEAQRYIIEHQQELRTYKIAYKSTRKNAIRHLHGVYYFASDEEAKQYFETVSMEGYILQLLTGDWKLLAEKQPGNIQ